MQNTFILSSKICHHIVSLCPGISSKSRISSTQVKVQMRLLRIKSASIQLLSSGNLGAEETNYQSLLYSTCNDEANVYFDAYIRKYEKWDVHRSHWLIHNNCEMQPVTCSSSLIMAQSFPFEVIFYSLGFTFWPLVLTLSFFSL